jgi:archaetidylinositol phosphate synthase
MQEPLPSGSGIAPPPLSPPRTWVHWLARGAIRPLIHTPVTPNHLTTVRLLTGIGAAACFALDAYLWTVWGGVLFMFSAFLDRADGELARLSGQLTAGGYRYDLGCDLVVNVLLFLGIGLGLRDGPLGFWAPLLGGVAGLAVGAIFWLVVRLEALNAFSAPAFDSTAGFDPDDFLFLVGPIAWLDGLFPLLIAASVGAPLFFLFVFGRYRQLRPHSFSPSPSGQQDEDNKSVSKYGA